MRQAAVLPPVAAADRHEVHLGHDERAANSRRNFRRAFCVKSNSEKSSDERASTAFQSFLISAPNPTLPEADVTVEVADRDVGLEARALASRRLLLHGLDSHNFVLQFSGRRREEVVDDLVLLDRPEYGKKQ